MPNIHIQIGFEERESNLVIIESHTFKRKSIIFTAFNHQALMVACIRILSALI